MTRRSLSPIRPDNPAHLGFPAGLPVELAMDLNSVRKICEGYGVTREDYEALMENPIFIAQLEECIELRGKANGEFMLKSRLMSTRALEEQFKMMVDVETPAAVRLKSSENIIAYSGMAPKQSADGGAGNGMSININLNNLPANPKEYSVSHGTGAPAILSTATLIEDAQ